MSGWKRRPRTSQAVRTFRAGTDSMAAKPRKGCGAPTSASTSRMNTASVQRDQPNQVRAGGIATRRPVVRPCARSGHPAAAQKRSASTITKVVSGPARGWSSPGGRGRPFFMPRRRPLRRRRRAGDPQAHRRDHQARHDLHLRIRSLVVSRARNGERAPAHGPRVLRGRGQGRERREMIRPDQCVVGSFATSDNVCPHCRHGFQSSCAQREFMSGTQAPYARVYRPPTARWSPRRKCRPTPCCRAFWPLPTCSAPTRVC